MSKFLSVKYSVSSGDSTNSAQCLWASAPPTPLTLPKHRPWPCKAKISVKQIENIRSAKRDTVIERAKELLLGIVSSASGESTNILDEVRSVLTLDTEIEFEEMTAGPNVRNSDAIIIVEGRNDVRNLLKFGINNAIATMGSGIKPQLAELASKKKTVTAFLDGDRGGKLLLLEISGTLG